MDFFGSSLSFFALFVRDSLSEPIKNSTSGFIFTRYWSLLVPCNVYACAPRKVSGPIVTTHSTRFGLSYRDVQLEGSLYLSIGESGVYGSTDNRNWYLIAVKEVRKHVVYLTHTCNATKYFKASNSYEDVTFLMFTPYTPSVYIFTRITGLTTFNWSPSSISFLDYRKHIVKCPPDIGSDVKFRVNVLFDRFETAPLVFPVIMDIGHPVVGGVSDLKGRSFELLGPCSAAVSAANALFDGNPEPIADCVVTFRITSATGLDVPFVIHRNQKTFSVVSPQSLVGSFFVEAWVVFPYQSFYVTFPMGKGCYVTGSWKPKRPNDMENIVDDINTDLRRPYGGRVVYPSSITKDYGEPIQKERENHFLIDHLSVSPRFVASQQSMGLTFSDLVWYLLFTIGLRHTDLSDLPPERYDDPSPSSTIGSYFLDASGIGDNGRNRPYYPIEKFEKFPELI
jgi:hypothetical protein